MNEEIEKLAYYKWEAAGRPWGRELEFWTEAEQELSCCNESTTTTTEGSSCCGGRKRRKKASSEEVNSSEDTTTIQLVMSTVLDS